MSSDKKDIYQNVTDQIVKAIEEGTESFEMPWRRTGGFPKLPVNGATKRPYRGINILILWALAIEKGYGSECWATYKQWQEQGRQVRKGEKSATVIFWKPFDVKEDSKSEVESAKRGLVARSYWLFNAEQLDGYEKPQEIPCSRSERIEHAEEFFRSLGVEIKAGGNEAFYRQADDAVFMPAFEAFREPLFYYSVLSHETTHNAASRIMPRCTTNPVEPKIDATRLIGIIIVTPGMRAAYRLADTVRASSPGQRLGPVLSP
jgi:antirestriction protein ArdC